jgi:hypothetical protein
MRVCCIPLLYKVVHQSMQRGSKGSVQIPLAVVQLLAGSEKKKEKDTNLLERLEYHTCTYYDQSHLAGNIGPYEKCAIAVARPAA